MRNKLLLIAVLLGGLSSLWAQENKLMNTVKTKRGGVENGEWYKNNLPNSSIMPVVNVAYEGDKSLRFVCNDRIDTRYKNFVAQKGLQLSRKKIKVSFYARSAKPVILNVSFVGFAEGKGNKPVAGRGENVNITGDNDWHLYTVEIDLGSGKIVSDKKTHVFYIDNISVKEKV